MNRRDLMKRLGSFIPALAMLPAILKIQPHVEPTEDEFIYHGWKVLWRGWIPIFNQDVLIGRWVAYDIDHIGQGAFHLYSCYPGNSGSALEGHMLDISLQSWQTFPSSMSSEKELDSYKKDARLRIVKLIDKAGPRPLTKPIWL